MNLKQLHNCLPEVYEGADEGAEPEIPVFLSAFECVP